MFQCDEMLRKHDCHARTCGHFKFKYSHPAHKDLCDFSVRVFFVVFSSCNLFGFISNLSLFRLDPRLCFVVTVSL